MSRDSRHAWTVALTGGAALAAGIGIGRFAFTPILPIMQQDAGVSIPQGGWLASANYVGYFLGSLWAMSIRVPPAVAIRVALLAVGISTLAMALTASLGPWLFLRLVAGVASAWVFIHVTSWCLAQLASLGRPVLGGVVFAGVGVGIIVVGALCLVLMRQQLGSSFAWASSAVIVLVAAALVWPVLGTADVAKPSEPRPTSPPYRWSPDTLRLVLCYGALGLAYIIPATFLPVLARQLLQDPSLFGWAWPVFGVAAAVSTLFAAPLIRALGDRMLWISSALVMAFGIASPLIIPGLTGIIVASLLVGGTFVVVTMAGIHVARAAGGAGAEALVAAFTAAFAMGQIVGPLVVSFFAARTGGFDEALVAAAALMAASALALAVPVTRTASMRG